MCIEPAASTCAGGAFNPRPAGLLRKALGPFVGCREAGSSPVGVQESTRCLHLRRRRVQSEAGRAPAKGPGLSWDAGKRIRAPSGSRKAPAASTCAGGAFNPRPAGLLRKALGPFVGCREAGSSPVGVQESTRCLRPADQAGARCCRRCIRDQLAKPYRSLKKNMIKHTRTET